MMLPFPQVAFRWKKHIILITPHLDLLKMPGKGRTYSLNWWFDGDLLWYKIRYYLKQIQANRC